MALMTRLRRLERDLGTQVCPECRGEAPWVVSHMHPDDPEPPTPQGCPACGDVNHVVVRYVKCDAIWSARR